MRYSELKAHLNEALNGGGFAAAYFVTGNDDFLVDETKKLFKAILDPSFADMNYSEADSVAEAVETLCTFPAFDIYRVCVLDAGKLSDEDVEALKSYLASPAEGSVLVACVGDAAKNFKGKNIENISCAPLSDEELNEYVRGLFSAPPAVSAQPAAITELITRTQASLARIVSEVQKLKAYSPSGVSKKDVEDMVASDIEYQTYILSEAVSNRDAQQAISVMDSILKSGIPERVLLGALYERYRRLLLVSLNKNRSNEDLARAFGFKKPGQVYFLKKSAENYSQVRLKNIVDLLHSLQFEIVSGARSEQNALHEAMLTILALQ